MKRILIVGLVLVFLLFSADAEAKVTPKGVPLTQYNQNSDNQNNDNQNNDNQNSDNQNNDNQNSDNQNSDNQNSDNQNNDNQNNDNQNNDTQNDGDKALTSTFITGARKVSNSKEFIPIGFELDKTLEFLALIMHQEGDERHTGCWAFFQSEEVLKEFEEKGKELNVIMKRKKILKEKDINKEFLLPLTEVFEDRPVIGVEFDIKDPSKDSLIMKFGKPFAGIAGSFIPGFNQALGIWNLGKNVF